jgi:hypothetical protein
MDTPLGDTPKEIAAFLTDGGYESMEAWMRDSDFHEDTEGNWYQDDTGLETDMEGAIEGAMEACGFEA